MDTISIISLTVIYMLIGFQMGGRMFFWSVRIRKTKEDYFVNLILVPILWPMVFLMSLLPNNGVQAALWKWYD